MKKMLLYLVFFLPFYAFSQISLKYIRQTSWQIFIYRVTAGEAEQFIQWDSIPVNRFERLIPSFVFHADSLDEDKLPTGNYVSISAKENNIQAELLCITDLLALTNLQPGIIQYFLEKKGWSLGQHGGISGHHQYDTTRYIGTKKGFYQAGFHPY